MNTENGWSKIRNDIHDDPLLNKDSEYLSVWIYLLTHQAYGEYKAMFSGKVITLKEGQLLTSRAKIAKATGVSDSKIKRILNSLKNDQRIDQLTDRQQSLITLTSLDVLNQRNDQQIDQRMTNDRPTIKETENEKEKRSKREKDKEKEIYKNIKTDKNISLYSRQLSGDSRQQEGEDFLSKYDKSDLEAKKDEIEKLFNEFWQAYPKKVGKGYAFECFKRIRVSQKLLNTMLEAIEKQKKSDMWKRDKGQYIPNPSTWLNQKRWEDDLGGETEENPWSSFKLGIEL
jgi:hypothetical protein